MKVIDFMAVLRSVRKPLPRQKGGPQGTKKGKRGYRRQTAKHELRQDEW